MWERHGTESALAVYSSCARLQHLVCISNASQSNRAKSKLEYCGAIYAIIQKRLAMVTVTTATGPTTTNRGSTLVYSFPTSDFHFNHWPHPCTRHGLAHFGGGNVHTIGFGGTLKLWSSCARSAKMFRCEETNEIHVEKNAIDSATSHTCICIVTSLYAW